MRRRRGRNRLKLGQHNVISDISGFKFKSGEMRKLGGDQKGLLVHKSEWNPSHPQLNIRGRSDDQSVRDPRVRPEDQFPNNPSPGDL